MPTPEKELRRIAFETIEETHPEPVNIEAIYKAVESQVSFTEDDLIPPNLHGKPVSEPRWKRNVRNALQSEKERLRLLNHSQGHWRLPTPLGSNDAIDPNEAWTVIQQSAEVARKTDRVFTSRKRKKSYRIGQVLDAKIEIIRVDGNKSSWLGKREVTAAFARFNASGGHSGARTLNYTVAKEQLIVDLHPGIEWSADKQWIVLTGEQAIVPKEQESVRGRHRPKPTQNREGLTGPGPSQLRSASIANTGPAVAYLLELHGGGMPVFKVGYTTDLKRRVQELNKGLVSAVTGYSWQTVRLHRFKDADSAYRFEQVLHERLRGNLVENESEIYTAHLHEIEKEWVTVIDQLSDTATTE